MNFIDKYKELNTKYKDLPRRAIVTAVITLALIICFGLLKYLAPFICALILSWLIKLTAKPIEALLTKLKLPRKIGAFIACVIVFGAIFALIVLLVSALMSEASQLIEATPKFVQDVSEYISKVAQESEAKISARIGDDALKLVYDMLKSALVNIADIATNYAAKLVTFTWDAVTAMPEIAIFILFVIMESYYIVADRDYIGKFISKWAPENFSLGMGNIRTVMLHGVRAQFLTAVAQMFAAFFVLLIGFMVLGVDYSVMFAILISVLDALPVIGAGLIMYPMAAYYLICGNYIVALGVIVLNFVVMVVKRVMEPKLLGNQMKLHQAATMISMYAGFKIIGFIGLIIGPLLLMLYKAILGGIMSTSQRVK